MSLFEILITSYISIGTLFGLLAVNDLRRSIFVPKLRFRDYADIFLISVFLWLPLFVWVFLEDWIGDRR